MLLLFAMVAEFDGRLLSQTNKRAVIAVLADPLSLLSERSPGLRGAGPLLSIKGKIAPHERALSTVRDRQPQVPNVVVSIPIIPPQYDTALAENRLGGLPPFAAAGPQAGDLASGPNPPMANPPADLSAPPETTAIPEPASWTMVGGPLAVGLLVRQYVRKRRPA
jgi:hypothetical protein